MEPVNQRKNHTLMINSGIPVLILMLFLCLPFILISHLSAEETSPVPKGSTLEKVKMEAEIAKLRAEVESLKIANESAGSLARRISLLLGSLGGLLGAFFSLVIYFLGKKVSENFSQTQEAKLEQDKELGREQHNLELFRSLGDENARVQLAAASVLLQRLAEFADKRKAGTLNIVEEREQPTIIQVLVAITKEPQSNPALVKFIADNLVTSLEAIIPVGQDPQMDKPSPLKGVDFQKSRLHNIWWKRVDARGLDFFRVDFSEAGLAEAFLQNTVFFEANLENCVLRDARLNKADLRRAKLQGANLMGADLQGARLAEANYSADTIWPDGFNPLSEGAILTTNLP
jgi:hypothetical protein